jgi:hypothetical protein
MASRTYFSVMGGVRRMKIVIVRLGREFEIRIIDDHGLTTRKFTYMDIEGARRTAAAWSKRYGDCRVIDQIVSK